jgi:hypothetical protein
VGAGRALDKKGKNARKIAKKKYFRFFFNFLKKVLDFFSKLVYTDFVS